MKLFILFGKPGAGKGVIAQKLKKNYNFHHLSLGEYLRKEVKKKSNIGLKYKIEIETGLKLLSSDIVFRIIKKTILLAMSQNKNLIIDGFPRTIYQYHTIIKFLKEKKINPSFFYLKAKENIIFQRLLNRETCINCSYDFILCKTKQQGICDFCDHKTYKRITDNLEDIKKRIDFFNKTTENVLHYIDKTLMKIDSNMDINQLPGFFINEYKALIN